MSRRSRDVLEEGRLGAAERLRDGLPIHDRRQEPRVRKSLEHLGDAAFRARIADEPLVRDRDTKALASSVRRCVIAFLLPSRRRHLLPASAPTATAGAAVPSLILEEYTSLRAFSRYGGVRVVGCRRPPCDR